jgi:hypothetical protein
LAESLLKYNTYLHYSLEVNIASNNGCLALIKFLESIDLHPRDLFHDLKIRNADYFADCLDVLFELYIKMGFIKKNVYFIDFEMFCSELFCLNSPNCIYLQLNMCSFYEFLEVYGNDMITFKTDMFKSNSFSFCNHLLPSEKEIILKSTKFKMFTFWMFEELDLNFVRYKELYILPEQVKEALDCVEWKSQLEVQD